MTDQDNLKLNLRKKEAWMVKGATVQLSTNTGTLTGLVEADINGVRHVLKMYVMPHGVLHSWPYNPHNVQQATKAAWTMGTSFEFTDYSAKM